MLINTVITRHKNTSLPEFTRPSRNSNMLGYFITLLNFHNVQPTEVKNMLLKLYKSFTFTYAATY